MQCLIKQISLSIINNHLSLMSLLQVSICTKFIIREIYTKACTSVQQILSQIRMCRMKIQHCQLELPKVFTNIQQIFFFTIPNNILFYIFHCRQTSVSVFVIFLQREYIYMLLGIYARWVTEYCKTE